MLLVAQGLCANLVPPPRPFGLFVVADGMPGPQGKSVAGREASRLAIETLADVLLPLIATPVPSRSTPGGDSSLIRGSSGTGGSYQPALQTDRIVEQWLREGVRRANSVIYHCNADYETTMASTMTVAFLHKRQLYVASVGDSRAYHYSVDKGLQRITKDHTLAANLVDAQLLKPEEVYQSEKRKQLYRYLGQSGAIQIDFFSRPIEINDLILLCTNGLWHMVRDERLAELLKQGQAGDTQKLARRLVDEANLCGGEGNVSAIVVRVL
jgi:serine/threonine protein phosphatase PrpC